MGKTTNKFAPEIVNPHLTLAKWAGCCRKHFARLVEMSRLGPDACGEAVKSLLQTRPALDVGSQ